MTQLSFREKSGYALGEIASSIIWQTLMFFLPIFYTDTFGIPAAVVGTMFMVVRIFDGINDPVMGILADRTKSRWGKFRPYILWMAIPYGIAGVLMFLTPDLGMTGKIIYAYTTYILMMLIYTAIMIPYNALSGVMTSDYLERTHLNSYRFIGAFVGGLFIQALALFMVFNLGKNDRNILSFNLEKNKLILKEIHTGTAKIRLDATDGEGARTRQEFLVKIFKKSENPPALSQQPEEIFLEQGFGQYRRDISMYFSDKDGDELGFSAKSLSSRIFGAEMEGTVLVLKEKNPGLSRVTVNVSDPSGNVVSAEIPVRITKKGNQNPVLSTAISNRNYSLREESPVGLVRIFYHYDEEKIDLDKVFTDPDRDELFYNASSENPEIVSVNVFGSVLVLKRKNPGECSIKVSAEDGNGGLTSTDFLVQIENGSNLPPEVISKMENISLESGFPALELNLDEYFSDKDGNLSYSVTLNNDARGYRRTMSVFGILCVFLFLIGFLSTRERVTPIKNKPSPLKQDIRDLMKNGPWIILFFVSLVTLIYVAIRSAVIAYYFRYYVGEPGLTAAFLVIGSVTIILALPFTRWLTKKMDKRLLYTICMLLVGISISLFYFTGPEDISTMFLLQILQSLGSAPTMPLLWSMLADSSDYSEFKTGRKAMGLTYSASTLAQKIGFGIGGAIALWLLAFYGYQPGVEQTQSSLFGMKMMMSFYPALGAFLCAVLISFYKLDAGKMKEVENHLARQRSLNLNSD